jgi:hypothetical protein
MPASTLLRIGRPALVAAALFLCTGSFAQNLSGQWTGGFLTTGDLWGGKTEYVLELEVDGRKVEGFSYTYFILAGKRHYVICKLEGEYDKGSKSLVVSEVQKVKSNTPPDFRDLFQTHRLTYLKQGDREVLQGKWKPYRSKESDQSGETTLERKALAKLKPVAPTSPIAQNKPPTGKPSSTQGATGKTSASPTPQKPSSGQPANPQTRPGVTQTPPVVVQKPSSGTRERNETPPAPKPNDTRRDPAPSQTTTANEADPGRNPAKIEQRSKKLVQLIEVDDASFKVELYDNGQVDGDTVSLYFNNRLMVSRKRLSTTPITLEIKLDRDKLDNELVMYAENMGSIPPNTALMVVTVRDKRYELNITSTEEANGTVRFRLRE